MNTMFLQNVQVVEKRTFLEFSEIEDAGVEEEHRLLMRRARSEPAQKNRVANRLATIAKEVPTAVHSCESSSTPRSSVSTDAPSWADVTDDDASSISTCATAEAPKSPSKEVAAATRQQNEDTRTTLMLRNLPNDYNRELFLDMLDEECLAGEYDFVYFPVDFQTGSGLGYAFVNFTSHEEAVRAWQLLDGFKDWVVGSTKVCEARWSNPVQGLTANVQRYRNSPVMHDKVPDSYKPVVFSNGVRVEYPAPKKPIKYYPGKKVSKHRN